MDKPLTSNKSQTSQAIRWSDAELRRVSRVFDLLIRIDKRTKKGKGNDKRGADNADKT